MVNSKSEHTDRPEHHDPNVQQLLCDSERALADLQRLIAYLRRQATRERLQRLTW